MRIVLDTNVLVQSLSARNALRPIFEAVLESKVELLVSTEILLEYEEVLLRHRSVAEVDRIVRFFRLAPNVHCCEPSFRFLLILADPDDNKFVDCYIAENATLLVTSDAHYRPLAQNLFPIVTVISPEAFLQLL